MNLKTIIIKVNWMQNEDDFLTWCEGNTGVPSIDAAMRGLIKRNNA